MTYPHSILMAGALLALACLALAFQQWRLRQRLDRQARETAASQDHTATWAESSALRQDQLTERLHSLEGRIALLNRQIEDLSRTPRFEDGHQLNLTQRLRVMRLSQRGESVSHIAAVLNIPAAEVELIVKLYPLTII